MSKYFPLLERVEIVRGDGESDVPRVWYRTSGAVDLPIFPGDWIVLVARANAVRRSGGYETGAPPPGWKATKELGEQLQIVKPEERRIGTEFRLDQSEIFFIAEPRELTPGRKRR